MEPSEDKSSPKKGKIEAARDKEKKTAKKAKLEAANADDSKERPKGKSIYGLERDKFRAAHGGTPKESQAAWLNSEECQQVLEKMSEAERKKRRLEHHFSKQID